MKKNLLLKTCAALLLLLTTTAADAADAPRQLLALEKYTVPVGVPGAVVGRFTTEEAVTLADDPSGLFEIVNNELKLRKKAAVTASSPMLFEIGVAYGGERKQFTIVRDEFIRNKVVAHRGAWKGYGYHQNSRHSLRKAIELGCEASEFDVWLTKDKYIALNHDYEYDGMIVELSKLADMRRVILEQGEVMATLDEYLEIIRGQNRTRLVLELKSTPANRIGLELADAAVAMVHKMGAQAWVDYISFDYEVLKRVRALDPTAHIAYLGAVVPMDQQKIEGMSGIDYHFSQFDNMPRLYDRARMLGLTINVWTVNDPKIMERMLDMGVDFITTDEPAMLLEMIEKRNER